MRRVRVGFSAERAGGHVVACGQRVVPWLLAVSDGVQLHHGASDEGRQRSGVVDHCGERVGSIVCVVDWDECAAVWVVRVVVSGRGCEQHRHIGSVEVEHIWDFFGLGSSGDDDVS